MIRLNPQRRLRISNRLALTGALLLSMTLFTGFEEDQSALSDMTSQQAALVQPVLDASADTTTNTKSFSISRMLFGHG